MRLFSFIVVSVLLSGCSAQQIGIRPEELPIPLVSNDSCADYLRYANYVQQLEASYYARATGNRAGSYFAGAATTGSVAGSAGLAAGSMPSAGTLALIAIGQGFLGTLFSTIDNPLLAELYTVAGNDLSSALDDSFAIIANKANPDSCLGVHVQLRHVVTTAKNNLELGRTDASSAALQRALHQVQHYNAIVSQFLIVSPREEKAILPQPALEAILDRIDQRLKALENKSEK